MDPDIRKKTLKGIKKLLKRFNVVIKSTEFYNSIQTIAKSKNERGIEDKIRALIMIVHTIKNILEKEFSQYDSIKTLIRDSKSAASYEDWLSQYTQDEKYVTDCGRILELIRKMRSVGDMHENLKRNHITFPMTVILGTILHYESSYKPSFSKDLRTNPQHIYSLYASSIHVSTNE